LTDPYNHLYILKDDISNKNQNAKREENMEIKYSNIIIIIANLAILIIVGGVAIPVSAATPTTSYFSGFSGYIDYGYSTTLSSVVISPSFSNSAFQEYDIKYGYSIPEKTNINQNDLSGRITQNDLSGHLGNPDVLFARAMVNYHVNPPKPITNPSPDFTFHNFDSVYISFT
jgi:hypothetical protein